MSFRSILRRLHDSAWDLALGIAALCFGAMLLMYPFGRDQGLYHYVGREWLRGSVPYRDMMEQKTPLIYVVYGIAYALFGEHFWSYRLIELGFVMALGCVLALTVTPRGERPARGLLGAAMLSLSISYVGYLNFWHSGQCELWTIGLSLCGLCVLERRGPAARFTLLAGILAGLAIAAKPTAVLFTGVIALCAMDHGQRAHAELRGRARGALHALGWYTLGASSVIFLGLGYFAAHRSLDSVFDVLVRCNGYYVAHESTAQSPAQMARQVREFALASLPLLDLVLVGLSGALAAGMLKRSQSMRAAVFTLGLSLAAVAGVCAQRKFFVYHWGVVLPLMALGFLCGAETLAGEVSRRVKKTWAGPLTLTLLAGCYAMAFWYTHTVSDDWRNRVIQSVRYARRDITRGEFLERVSTAGYDLRAQEEIGRWIAAHSAERDLVAMRNFEPAMYLSSHRSARLRFFWSPWISWPHRAYRREQWLMEDQREMRELSPRYVVAVEAQREGVEAPRHYFPEYEARYSYGGFVVMEYTNTHLDRSGRGAHDHGRALRVVRALGVFENPGSGLDGWELEGDAMRAQPLAGTVGTQNSVTGFQGDALLNSFSVAQGDAATGSARFVSFRAPAGVFLGMLVGGGMSDETSVVLKASGETVATWHGEDTEHLRWVTHDLTNYVGKDLQIEVTDRGTGPWAHILVDHIVLLR